MAARWAITVGVRKSRTTQKSPKVAVSAKASTRPRGSEASGSDRSLLSRYFSEIRAYPLLTKEQEQRLAHRVRKGDPEAFENLVASNLSFVVKVASEYRNLGLSLEDLLNEGNLGLIEAARRYDPSKGTKFITYAIWWIRKSILKALAEQVNLVRVPTYQMKKVRELRETEQVLRKELGRSPERSEISDRLDVSLKKVDQTLQVRGREVSIDDTVGKEKKTPVSEFLVDPDFESAEDNLLKREGTSLVTDALDVLSDQERIVIKHRFGLEGCAILTLKEIGDKMGVSRERVRQIETQAKLRLKRMFNRPRGNRTPTKKGYAVRSARGRGPLD
ncbi:MAG: RNA polymerase sigma factor RpoD/SigA [Acidobacteriota bacterium]